MLVFESWKKILVVVVLLAGAFYAAPNITGPNILPTQPVNLGLDLQGGSHLLMRADMDAVVKERMAGLSEDIRLSLRDEKLRFKNLTDTDNSVEFSLRDSADIARRDALLAGYTPEYEVIHDGLNTTITLSDGGYQLLRQNTVEQAIEIIRRRLDPDGTKEPVIQQQGAERVLIQLPGVDDPERIKTLLGQTARLTFQMVDLRMTAQEAQSKGRTPPGAVLLPSYDEEGVAYVVEKRVVVSGDELENATAGFDQNNRPAVNFTLSASGGRKFGQATGANIGRPFAIILDGKVVSAPTIQAQIFTQGQITGSFSVQESNDLALVLRAGALPAPLIVIEERSIGPGLGADSVAAGQIAAVIGLILVAVFMVATYGLFGIFANVALLANIILILGGLSAIGATLTLPGIAGIVLTMGMAVDANVLVFERIKEEMMRGRNVRSAIEAGYNRAIATILDANLTTLFAALFLYIFGSGPVRGFAVTLSIGIVTSLFTAILVTRLFVVLWANRSKKPVLVL